MSRTFAVFATDLEERGLRVEIVAFCAVQNLRLDEVYARSQTKKVVETRSFIWRWLANEKRFSMTEIGRMWGRDASTISYSIKKYKDLPLPKFAIGVDMGTPGGDMAAVTLIERLANGVLRILDHRILEERAKQPVTIEQSKLRALPPVKAKPRR